METTRLSSKGQVILPKALRDARHWLPGTEFEVENRPEGVTNDDPEQVRRAVTLFERERIFHLS